MSFEFRRQSIPEVVLIRAKQFNDDRGYFMELHRRSAFESLGLELNFVQYNCSRSKRGVLRGLHYQLRPYEQGKLVTVIGNGRIFDVAVDIRAGSPTFGRWAGAELRGGLMLWVPPGFAHGFLALEDDIHVLYGVTGAEYRREAERGIAWNDPDIGIAWPGEHPIVSSKDAALPPLKNAEVNFVYAREGGLKA